jgi:threonine synthase
MKLCSTNDTTLSATFLEAVERGSPADGGLYVPTAIPAFPASFIRSLTGMPFQEIAFSTARLLIEDEIPDHALRKIIEDSITFPAPLHMLSGHRGILELFHGPTLAFKDFGARFMARVMTYIQSRQNQATTVLVATSGDTGSAVAHGFRDAEGTSVLLLYPSGRVSPLQELQLTTAGPHTTALEIEGTFDDCQRLVKQAFLDAELSARKKLTSANSINIARLVPQAFYYINAFAQLEPGSPPVVFAVPSGNLGNLTAGLIARKMGLPVHHFVAGTNANDALVRYLRTGAAEPVQTVATISSAMDVGNPSNLARIRAIFRDDLRTLRKLLTGWAVTDQETRDSIKMVLEERGYFMDPHTAVAWYALSRYARGNNDPHTGIVLSTAHPAKFGHLYDEPLKSRLKVPEALSRLRPELKRSVRLSNRYDEFKEFLLQS